MFGSTGHPEPPTCFVDVYADQKSDTARRLKYKVPMLGVEPMYEISINLSLSPRSVKFGQNSLLSYNCINGTFHV